MSGHITITDRDTFIDWYLANSKLVDVVRTPTGFRCGDYERVALRCTCGDETCAGWAMIKNDPEAIEWHTSRQDGT